MSWDEAEGGFGAEEEGDGHLAALLLDPRGVIQRRWIPMVLCGAIAFLVTVVAVIVWEPTYRAGATVLISRQEIPDNFIKSTVADDTLSNIDAMLGQVLSVENVSAMIEHLELFPDRDGEAQMALVSEVRSNVEAGPVSRPSRGADSIVYELAYVSNDPREAARVANGLAALFIEENIARRTSQARRTTEFLEKAARDNEEELSRVASEISSFRQSHRGELPDDLPGNLRKVDGLNSQITSITQQIAVKEDRILELTSHGGDAVLSEAEVLLGELRRELARQTAAHTDAHPNVIALRERITRLEEEVSRGGRTSVGSARVIESERRDIARLVEQRAEAEAKLAELNARIDRMPVVAEQLAAIQQREKVLREEYLESMRKVEDAQLAEKLESAQQGGQVSMLDVAPTPRSPEYPRWLVAVGGVVLSGFLAVAVAILLELIDPVVLSVRQIQRKNPSPVLGSLPYVS